MDGERRLRRHWPAWSERRVRLGPGQVVVLVSSLLALLAGPLRPPPLAPRLAQPDPTAAAPSAEPRQFSPSDLVAFEPNLGQAGPEALFVARGHGLGLTLEPGRATVSAGGSVIGLALVGAAPDPVVAPDDLLPGVSNHLTGPDPSRWRQNVPRYASVRYRSVYPGIDLVFHGSAGGKPEYDFVVAPGADPDQIRLRIEGTARPWLDGDGRLIVPTAGGDFVQQKPTIYQEALAGRTPIDGGFVLDSDGVVSFGMGRYDSNRTLVIDPVLDFSTYLGGSSTDSSYAVAVDGVGNAYVTGVTASTDFPRRGGLPLADPGGEDAYVAKFDPMGALVYATYFGGSGQDQANNIAVDAAGAAYIVGSTSSTDLPVANAFQPASGGQRDAFVAKLAPSGSSLVFSTYVGGSSLDNGGGIGVDGSGRVWLAGTTHSPNFPGIPPSGRDMTMGDGFVARLAPTGGTLGFATLVGGSSAESILDLAVDTSGAAYVGGTTWSTDLPTTPGAFIPTNPSELGPPETGFVAKFDPAVPSLAYLSYLGGEEHDAVRGVAVDAEGALYATGYTTSHDFPRVGPFQGYPDYYDQYDQSAFVTKLNPSGTGAVYSSFLGGSERDIGDGIDVDGTGRAYVVGMTASPNFPAVDAMQPFLGGPPGEFTDRDAFVVRVAASGSTLEYASWLGGGDVDRAFGVAAHSSGRAVVVGATASSDFPVASPVQGRSGPTDGFVTRVSAQLGPGTSTYVGSTHLPDGSFRAQGGNGARVSAFALRTVQNKAHQLVTAHHGGCTSGSGLVPVNPAVRHSNGRGFIPTTSGEIHRTPGEYEVCFRALDGQTATLPAYFTIV